MTPLRKRMLEDMQLRNLSQSTIETYLELIQRFARYFKKSPQYLGAEEVRGYLLHDRRKESPQYGDPNPFRIALSVCLHLETKVV